MPTFADLGLAPAVTQSLTALGYEEPTPIQVQAIPPLLAGRDMLGQAATGTGKTAAFALPMLQRIDLNKNHTQVLVLTPTRELAIQVAKFFSGYAENLRGLRVAAVYGGQDYQIQFRQLDRGAHVIVGTPGRVMDHMRRGSIKLDNLSGMVLDEADEMLRMGFAEDVEWVLSQAPATRQTALFSATLPGPIRNIAQKHLTNPAEIVIKQRSATADTVRQRFVIAPNHHKQQVLDRILEAEQTDGVIVFVRTKMTSEPLAEFLASRGHRTAVLHGDIAQKQRERIVENLRNGKLDILVATDVAARGLDVQRISHVVNYDLPFDSEAYVHRIGRTGRAGRSGEAILFVHPRDRHLLKRLENATRQKIEPMDVPTNRAINKQRVARFHEKISAALEHPQLAKYASVIEHFQRDNETPWEQLAAALAVMANGDVPLLMTEELKQPTFSEDRPSSPPPHRSRNAPPMSGDRPSGSRRDQGLESYRIEVGHQHQVKPGNIVGAIASESGLDSWMIGRIDIYHDYSVVALPSGMPSDIFQNLKRLRVAGQPLNISRMDGPAPFKADRPRPDKFRSDKPQFDKPKLDKPKRKKVVAEA